MNALRFDRPVHLTVGIGIAAAVESVEQAYAILNDWPSWRRTPAHAVALNACKAALSGKIDEATARAALAAFARRADLSYEEIRDRRAATGKFVPRTVLPIAQPMMTPS
jgi:hypothetical protein